MHFPEKLLSKFHKIVKMFAIVYFQIEDWKDRLLVHFEKGQI